MPTPTYDPTLLKALKGAAAIMDSGCWEIPGAGEYRKFRGEFAHRVAWVARFGPLPDGQVVRFKCGNHACCNPQHLWIGPPGRVRYTGKDAARWPKVNRHREQLSSGVRQKLDTDAIRRIYVDPRPSNQIAEQYGVSRAMVSHIKMGRRHAQVTQDLDI